MCNNIITLLFSMAGPQQPGRLTLPDASTPRLAPASPPRGVDGATGKPGVGQERVSPRLPSSPSLAGVAGRAVRRVETRPTSSLPARDPLSRAAPSWASVVRDGGIARLPPSVTRSDFLALYERCVEARLQARISIRHQAGSQDITISCRIISSSMDANAPADGRRRRRRRRRARTGTTFATNAPRPDLMSDQPPSPVAPSPVVPSPPSASATSPPAKRTRKATKRRCEVELLRDDYTEETNDNDDFPVSPLACSYPEEAPENHSLSTSFEHVPPAKTSPTTTTSTPTPPSPPGPASPQPAPSPPSTPTPPPAPASPPTSAATASTSTTTTDGPEPPPPPPWPEGYVFSDDPDRIICRKCCKRHYNYKWYRHCFLCHVNES
jgi:hypothetical protein